MRSPGRLDEIVDPQASVLSASGNKVVSLKREADGFIFALTGNQPELIAAEKRMGVRDWTGAGIGIVKPMFYARASAATAAATTPAVHVTSQPGPPCEVVSAALIRNPKFLPARSRPA